MVAFRECPICKQKFINLGVHMISCYGKTNPLPITPADVKPEISNKSMLDELEKETAQHLRIMNMQQMMINMRNPPKPQAEQQSEIETFKKFLDLQKTMKDEILDNYGGEEAEESSFEEKLGLKAVDLLLQNRKTPSFPMDNPPDKTLSSLGGNSQMKIPNAQEIEEARKKIKSGEMSFDDLKKQVKEAYPNLPITDQQLYAEYEKLKNS